VTWLDEQLGDPTKLRVAFAAAARKLGTDGDADIAGRVALLVAAKVDAATLRDMYRRGELRERIALLRALPVLDDAAHVETAIDACRTNVLTVFEAIACDNAYPAKYFPDAAFFQMVLKALFVGAPLGKVVGLRERTTDELVRMVDAYASERRAAGRPVPDDAKLVPGMDR
jgi:hypothetical protein